jgi:rhodanese-related sulfurtransferase
MIENLTPQEAFVFLQNNPGALLLDVRTKIEHAFVGHPIGAVHIAWKEGVNWEINPNFISEVKNLVPEVSTPILLFCRSGQRSLSAAKELETAGFQHLINILDGFEGPLNHENHRGTVGGWRFCGLPWQQT